MARLLRSMAISIFMTDAASAGVEPAVLITLPDFVPTEEPLHRHAGKTWRLFARFHDDPRNLIIGASRVDRLLRQGYLVSDLPIEVLIKRRKENRWG